MAAHVVLRDPSGRLRPPVPLSELAPGTDRWGARVSAELEGRWTYTVEAWSDPVATWRSHAAIKIPAGLDTGLTLLEGAELYTRAAAKIPKRDGREAVLAAADAMRDEDRPVERRYAAALAPAVDAALAKRPYRELVTAAKALP